MNHLPIRRFSPRKTGAVILLVLPLFWGAAVRATAGPESPAMATLRREALNRQRRVIFNNDGDDYRLAGSFEEFLELRTAPLAGTHVDTIFYCSNRSSFDRYSHRTEIGRTVDNESMQRFLERETDPLQVMIDFCREHGIEIFSAVRMNDTHDAWWPRERFEATDSFKRDRPDLLIGSRDHRPVYGSWGGLDYAHQEVRDLRVRLVEELCRAYDIDGIELDFFRHPMHFAKEAWGEAAGPEEWAMMTEMVGRIRAVLLREGERRGRPFLLALRSFDDLEYNRQQGLDIETWMREGWIDLFIPSGYFQLRPWADSVALGRRYGVRVYAGLSESRVLSRLSGEEARRMRQHPRSYRARALNAWDAGVDGLYLFNLFNPRLPQWRELGDPALLETLEKDYFASVRGVGRVPISTWPYESFLRVPTLTPDHPLSLRPGFPRSVPLRVGEHLDEQRQETSGARVSIHLQVAGLEDPSALAVTVNDGEVLPPPRVENGWWLYDPPAQALLIGWNTFGFLWNGEGAPAEEDAAIDVRDLFLSVRFLSSGDRE